MTTPNQETEQPATPEPEGIRRLREDYGPEKATEILASVRRAADNPEQGEWMTLEEFMEKRGIKPEDVGLK